MTGQVHEQACDFLLDHVRRARRQEELCFALWRPGTGATRKTALIFDIIPPSPGERHLHGNASFEPTYLARAVRLACTREMGLAFMHNHLAGGWQDMSETDVIAERDRISPPARATGLPLVGLTLGTDGSWSARFWMWDGRQFNRSWCDKVRVAGRRLRITFNDHTMPAPKRRPALRRTIDTWGEARQRDIARLRLGVVGVGSVGCMVAEALARIGVEKLVLIDPDRVETHNLDRLLYAGTKAHTAGAKASCRVWPPSYVRSIRSVSLAAICKHNAIISQGLHHGQRDGAQRRRDCLSQGSGEGKPPLAWDVSSLSPQWCSARPAAGSPRSGGDRPRRRPFDTSIRLPGGGTGHESANEPSR